MLSRREKIILTVTLVALGVLVFDQYIWTPITQQREALAAEKVRLADELQSATRLLRARKEVMPRWHDMAGETIAADAAAAETKLLHALRNWARDARLNLSSIQPERPAEKGELRQVILSGNATGSMASIARFLYLLESSTDTPVKVQRMRLAAGEGRDQLTLELRVSTLYRTEPEKPRGRPARPAASASNQPSAAKERA